METPTGPRGNRILVLLVLPFYLAWSAVRWLTDALIAALRRAVHFAGRVMRELGAVILALAGRLEPVARMIGRILARIGRSLIWLARIVLRLVDATIGRALSWLWGVLGWIRVALTRAVALVIPLIWDARSPIRIVVVAFISAARRFARGFGRLVRAAVDLARAVIRAIGVRVAAAVAAIQSIVGPVVARILAGVRAVGRGLARALGFVASAVARALRQIVIVVAGVVHGIALAARAVLRLLQPVIRAVDVAVRALRRGMGRVRAAFAPVTVAAGRLVADVRRAVSPLSAAIAAAARDAQRTVRQITGRPEPQVRPHIPVGGRRRATPPYPKAHRVPDARVPYASAQPAPSEQSTSARRSPIALVAVTTAVILLAFRFLYDLLGLHDEVVAIAVVLGVGFLAGLAHPDVRDRDGFVGFGLGAALAIAISLGADVISHVAVESSPVATWLGITIFGLPTFVVGGIFGRVTGPPSAHPH